MMSSTLSSPSSVLTSTISFLGLDDARLGPSDWSFERNPFWTTFLLTLLGFPCLFYLTWYLNPSLSKNRLGLSWVLGFYSATLFTIAGLYEVPHLRTIFNSVVDYQPAAVATSTTGEVAVATAASLISSVDVLDLATSATRDVCFPLLKAGTLALVATLPSFLRLESGSYAKYYCFSDFGWSAADRTSSTAVFNCTAKGPLAPIDSLYAENQRKAQDIAVPSVAVGATTHTHHSAKKDGGPLSLRHRVYQGQMQRPHLVFSLENYPDDGRIGPHIIAANFQAFLVVDLILGFIHYRRQLEPFSTVVHHIIYYFIVVHMRAGDMLSVFCICGTPIEASSIFLAFGRMFPHRRTKTIERLYLLCFISTRLAYVALLWHEIYFNYPDKSVSFLYTITLSLHIYWFVLYIKTQRKFQAKQRSQQLCAVLQSLACTAKDEFVSSTVENAKISVSVRGSAVMATKTQSTTKAELRFLSAERFDESENRASVELDEMGQERPKLASRESNFRGGVHEVFM